MIKLSFKSNFSMYDFQVMNLRIPYFFEVHFGCNWNASEYLDQWEPEPRQILLLVRNFYGLVWPFFEVRVWLRWRNWGIRFEGRQIFFGVRRRFFEVAKVQDYCFLVVFDLLLRVVLVVDFCFLPIAVLVELVVKAVALALQEIFRWIWLVYCSVKQSLFCLSIQS